ncbi:hypothetical protein AAFF_G00001550 [Aldrovandia affinis]|uniref:E3 ubiquitin-protein ligase RNF182 n=1 Tax=Aldrovandia affinis TaxID=143900 RepID=A0AAD7TEF1_9TELE|nr:hypothetical protein AAFF_G00001550 [Aldrovandia affinis]
MIEQASEDALSNGGVCAEELECKICYHVYNLGARRPKVLECCHRMCAKCLSKMAGLAELTPHSVVCPFCRYPTSLRRELVGGLPDDSNIVMALALRGRNRRKLNCSSAELLLSPESLTPVTSHSSSSSSAASSSSSVHGSSDCLVFTVMEAQDLLDHHNSSQTPGRYSPTPIPERWTVWRLFPKLCWFLARMPVWFLGLLYVTSIPLGIYLLIMRRTILGVFLVSLIPVSLLTYKIYDVCFNFCREYCCCNPLSTIIVPP